jgi:nucleotide-binding universal stress UspA family protein
MLHTVLVPLDQSSPAEQALGMAATLAKATGARIELLLCHPTTAYGELLETSPLLASGEESIYLNAMVDELGRRTGLVVRGQVRTGRAAEVICARAREVSADLIVMTSHGRTGLRRALLGSVTDEVVRESPIPVLVLRPTATVSWRVAEPVRFRRILIPLDGVTRSDAIIEAALRIARACHVLPILLLRVVHPITLYASGPGVPFHPTPMPDPEGTALLAERAREDLIEVARHVERAGDVRAEISVAVSDQPARTLLEIAESRKADLIAMATNARGASRLVAASVTDQVMRDCSLPLLLLHPTPAAVMSEGLLAPDVQESLAAVGGDSGQTSRQNGSV